MAKKAIKKAVKKTVKKATKTASKKKSKVVKAVKKASKKVAVKKITAKDKAKTMGAAKATAQKLVNHLGVSGSVKVEFKDGSTMSEEILPEADLEREEELDDEYARLDSEGDDYDDSDYLETF